MRYDRIREVQSIDYIEEVQKFNPYHGKDGRFASANEVATIAGESAVKAMAKEMGQDNISAEDTKVLRNGYFGSLSFRELNDTLRTDGQLSEEQKEVVEVADRNMRPSTKNIVLDRYMLGGLFQQLGLDENAIKSGDEEEAKKAIGKTTTDKAYMSTTYDASEVPFPWIPDTTILMHITAPKGTNMLIRPDHKEAEILLARNTSVKIKNIQKAPSGIYEVDAEIVK